MNEPIETHALEGFPATAIGFVRALERNRELIADDHGVSPTDLRALFWIAKHGSVTPKAVAQHMEMTTGGVTSVANRLEGLGLLRRSAHPNDRRSLYLELTERGHGVMRDIHREFNAMISDSTSGLSKKELAAFGSALQVVADEVNRRTAR